jgi:hypothetical protein
VYLCEQLFVDLSNQAITYTLFHYYFTDKVGMEGYQLEIKFVQTWCTFEPQKPPVVFASVEASNKYDA